MTCVRCNSVRGDCGTQRASRSMTMVLCSASGQAGANALVRSLPLLYVVSIFLYHYCYYYSYYYCYYHYYYYCCCYYCYYCYYC